jgi:hypothetical protein
MIDIDPLEALAKAAGGDAWTPTHATRTDLASVWLPDGDSVCRCHGNIGHWPDPIDADDIAEFIAAANPAAVLSLIAEVRALRTRLEIDPRHSYDGIYCRDETIRQLEEDVRALREDATPSGVRVESYSLPDAEIEIVRVKQRSGPDKWKAFHGGCYCLNKSGQWELEPMPSSRDDDFIDRCRFDTAQEAIDAARGAK